MLHGVFQARYSSRRTKNSTQHRWSWLLVLAAFSSQTVTSLAAAPGSTNTLQQSQPVQYSVPARYCPDGGSLEAGLCYKRCKPGYRPLGCTCFKGITTYSRGCGVRPRVCQSMSYRRQRLPAVTSRQPFSLVLSADPQLYRVLNDYNDVKTATMYNTKLVESINQVMSLKEWTWEAGGGAVQEPRALVMLGDMTEFYTSQQVDAFRFYYDSSMPVDDSTPGQPGEARIRLPTWLMFGNHDYVNNVNDCSGQFMATDRNICAKAAVDTMRSVLTPGCDNVTWSNFPRNNVTSFDADSMAYSFDYDNWHFVVLQYSPSYKEPSIAVRSSMAWLSAELSAATAQQRRIVLLVHAHREGGLASDPTFTRLVANSNVMAIFYGHVHLKPWGFTGNYPGTNVPMFNCGASWYHVYCYAEFGQDRLRVAAAVHNTTAGSSIPQWHGTSVHALLRQQKAKPVLQQFTMNPQTKSSADRSLVCAWFTVLGTLPVLFMLVMDL